MNLFVKNNSGQRNLLPNLLLLNERVALMVTIHRQLKRLMQITLMMQKLTTP
jgi:hypothetical protein